MYRVPKCHGCGLKKPRRPQDTTIWRIDWWMMRRDTSATGKGCPCFGYPFVHRKGSYYCRHYHNAKERDRRETRHSYSAARR